MKKDTEYYYRMGSMEITKRLKITLKKWQGT